MKARAWTVVTAVCLAASFGCSKSSGSSSPSGGFVSISPSKGSIVANGVNTVTLNVTDTSGGPVTVTTTRGTFSGGGATATVPGTSGTLTLVTCNASTDVTCAGNATVNASSPGGGTANTSITFGALATVCRADCTADPGCATLTCNLAAGGTGTCSSTTPSACVGAAACTPNPPGATTESSCSDGIDNDCNGHIDCDDPACDNQQCQTGAPTMLCQSGQCTDTASGLAIEVTPARTRLPANGATTAIVVKVTSGTAGAGGMGVTIGTNLGAFAGAATASGTTGQDGTVTFTYTGPTTNGVATITASIDGIAPTIFKTATITIPRLGSFFVPQPFQHPVLGVITSGWNESGPIQVQVLDDGGQPYPDGLAVRFEHHRLGGSTFGAPLSPDTGTCLAANGCIGYQGVTSSGADEPDTDGLATAYVYSGTVAGTLYVTATTTAGNITRSVVLPTLAVVGAKASGANFSIQCSPRNVPALAETDCSTSWVDAPFTCVAELKDRFGNLLGVPTQVIFVSEAGAVGQVASTPAYDPTKDPTDQADLGTATQIFNTLGAGLPFDVAPQVGEPSAAHAADGCGNRTHNPRDGVVTIIAIADGEQGFFDSNGNGSYNTGEPWIDQGEPFVDANDNGDHDAGEWFLDVNGNETYDGPNDQWKGDTKIWTQTVVVYTGAPATLDVGSGNTLGTRWSNSPVNACTSTPVASFVVHPANSTAIPPTPASSVVKYVYASDMNLNMLSTGTTYDASVVIGTVKADYLGFPKYADVLGFGYQYWPCDQSGFCASQCRSTGAALPCVMTPSLTSFQCGFGESVVITGGSSADPVSPLDEVDWNVSTPYEVYGSGHIAIDSVAITGTNVP